MQCSRCRDGAHHTGYTVCPDCGRYAKPTKAWSLHVYGNVTDAETAQRIANFMRASFAGLGRAPAVEVTEVTFDADGVGTLDLMEPEPRRRAS